MNGDSVSGVHRGPHRVPGQADIRAPRVSRPDDLRLDHDPPPGAGRMRPASRGLRRGVRLRPALLARRCGRHVRAPGPDGSRARGGRPGRVPAADGSGPRPRHACGDSSGPQLRPLPLVPRRPSPNLCPESRYLGSAAQVPHTDGGFATRSLLAATRLIPLPDALDRPSALPGRTDRDCLACGEPSQPVGAPIAGATCSLSAAAHRLAGRGRRPSPGRRLRHRGRCA